MTGTRQIEEKQSAVAEQKSNAYLEKYETKEFIFEIGTLKAAVSGLAKSVPVLTDLEEAELVRAKAELKRIVDDLKNKKALYAIMLSKPNRMTPNLKVEHTVYIRKASESQSHPATLEEINNLCKSLQKDALEFIKYITSKASKLLNARQYKRTGEEFKFALSCCREALGAQNVETSKIQLDYGIALTADNASDEIVQATLQDAVEKLKTQLVVLEKEKADLAIINDIKKAIAIGAYILAQHYAKNNNLVLASQYIKESEDLRKSYGASEKELDKIRYIRAILAIKSEDTNQAFKLFKECYDFRSVEDRYSTDLIPVLEMLIQVIEKNTAQQFIFLRHLCEVQKHNGYEEKVIIITQLKMIKAMSYYTSEKEYWDVYNDIKKKLDKIPITKESHEVGLLYMQLIDTSMGALLPQEWSQTRKKEYYVGVLKIIFKAKLHFNAGSKEQVNDAVNSLEKAESDCQKRIKYFTEYLEPFLIGEPIHPEDAAELALQQGEDKAHESSTVEHLMTLSTFSSEVQHSLVVENNRILTIEGFETLKESGSINPIKLRTAQGGINSKFRDGRSLEDMIEALVKDPRYRSKIQPVEIGIYKGKVYSFDTRRVIVHQKAWERNPNVLIRYKRIFGKYLEERVAAIFSPRPWKGAVTAVRRGGINSESEPYINPALRGQLDDTVAKTFKPFPSTRKIPEEDDLNGFPIKKKKAEKIFKYLKERQERGSKQADKIINQATKIGKTQGKEAAYDYLLKTKADIKNKEDGEDLTKPDAGAGIDMSANPMGLPTTIPMNNLDTAPISSTALVKSSLSEEKNITSTFKEAEIEIESYHALAGSNETLFSETPTPPSLIPYHLYQADGDDQIFQEVPILPDGNCLFASVIEGVNQLRQSSEYKEIEADGYKTIDTQDPIHLRKAVIDQLRKRLNNKNEILKRRTAEQILAAATEEQFQNQVGNIIYDVKLSYDLKGNCILDKNAEVVISRYLELMAKDKTWGGDLELSVASDLLNIRVAHYEYEVNGGSLVRHIVGRNYPSQVHIYYTKSRDHYQLLIPILVPHTFKPQINRFEKEFAKELKTEVNLFNTLLNLRGHVFRDSIEPVLQNFFEKNIALVNNILRSIIIYNYSITGITSDNQKLLALRDQLHPSRAVATDEDVMGKKIDDYVHEGEGCKEYQAKFLSIIDVHTFITFDQHDLTIISHMLSCSLVVYSQQDNGHYQRCVFNEKEKKSYCIFAANSGYSILTSQYVEILESRINESHAKKEKQTVSENTASTAKTIKPTSNIVASSSKASSLSGTLPCASGSAAPHMDPVPVRTSKHPNSFQSEQPAVPVLLSSSNLPSEVNVDAKVETSEQNLSKRARKKKDNSSLVQGESFKP